MEKIDIASSVGHHTVHLLWILMVIEVVWRLWAKSLALLADAGYMLTDIGSLSMGLLALSLAQQPHAAYAWEAHAGNARTVRAGLLSTPTFGVVVGHVAGSGDWHGSDMAAVD